MSGTKRRGPLAAVIVVSVVVISIIVACVLLYQKSRNDAARRMERAAISAGFLSNLDAEWKDECVKRDRRGKCTKTESELDAPTTVAGCPIGLESQDSGKTYKLDEVNWGNDPDGIDVADGEGGLTRFTTINPTRVQVYDYLEKNKSKLTCFKANPAKS